MEEKALLYAYLAGLVDGEGTISVKTKHTKYAFEHYLNVSNTNYEVIKLFQTEFGGKVRKRVWSKTQNKKGTENWKDCYEWILTAYQAGSAIELLFPDLRIKKRQAVLVLRLNKLKHKYNRTYMRWHPEIREKRDKVYAIIKARCKKLNQRGKHEQPNHINGASSS